MLILDADTGAILHTYEAVSGWHSAPATNVLYAFTLPQAATQIPAGDNVNESKEGRANPR